MSGLDYHLRPATEADFEFLFQLHVATMREHVERTWGWDCADQTHRFRERFDPAHCWVVVQADQDVGMIDFVDRGDRVCLNVVEILPGHQRKGLGTQIIRDLVEHVAAGRPVELQVLKVNPARRLYERLGFRTVGETDTHWKMQHP